MPAIILLLIMIMVGIYALLVIAVLRSLDMEPKTVYPQYIVVPRQLSLDN